MKSQPSLPRLRTICFRSRASEAQLSRNTALRSASSVFKPGEGALSGQCTESALELSCCAAVIRPIVLCQDDCGAGDSAVTSLLNATVRSAHRTRPPLNTRNTNPLLKRQSSCQSRAASYKWLYRECAGAQPVPAPHPHLAAVLPIQHSGLSRNWRSTVCNSDSRRR